jgi:hypothetical protein
MREIRSSGSVEGVVINHDSYSDSSYLTIRLFALDVVHDMPGVTPEPTSYRSHGLLVDRQDAACCAIPRHMKESTRNSNFQHLAESRFCFY